MRFAQTACQLGGLLTALLLLQLPAEALEGAECGRLRRPARAELAPEAALGAPALSLLTTRKARPRAQRGPNEDYLARVARARQQVGGRWRGLLEAEARLLAATR